MVPHVTNWAAEAVCRRVDSAELAASAAEVYRLTCRTDLEAPGFCLLNLGGALSSRGFRRRMAELAAAMSSIHQSVTGDTLSYLSAGRFDQQTSTKPHRDAGPHESFLMLGYEPSSVGSELTIYDYTRCAHDHGITPEEMLAKHNPMFRAGLEMLQPYATLLDCYAPSECQILCVNNSCMPFSGERRSWLGVLHSATVPEPDEAKRRVINSTMLCPTSRAGDDALASAAVAEFALTSTIHRRGYDKSHLQDDA